MRTVAFVSGKYGGFRASLPLIRRFQRSWNVNVYLCDQHKRDTAEEALALIPSAELLDGELDRVTDLFSAGKELAERWRADPPNAVIVYGDRLDALIGATVAHEVGIPVAHLQAGDLSGCIDNANRYAISALATWAFCSTAAAARRVEEATAVWGSPPLTFVVGDHHIDAVLEAEAAQTRSPLSGPYVVLHLHPDTCLPLAQNLQIARTVNAGLYGWDVVAMRPCTDRMGEEVWHATNARYRFDQLPLEAYVGLLTSAVALVGNSSAVLLDAPALGVPSILVGARQEGREGPEVPRVSGYEAGELTRALERLPVKTERSVAMGDGEAGARTFEVLQGLIP